MTNAIYSEVNIVIEPTEVPSSIVTSPSVGLNENMSFVFEAIDIGQILPHSFIIVLYGLVLFTAGSFKIERLVKDR